MVLAFKSNHDIQVMIGGLDALLRIFYSTKYVTKMQEHIDSITAVPLAAFRRRQLREARDEEAVADTNRTTIGRRRVASLLYAITNRREIAGPLAALYVQRGSCAFVSTPCATFHLRAILHELIDQDAHSCDLVELRGCDSSVTFRAASILDDYSYRPPGRDYLILYEYVTRHFRRKRTPTTSECVLFQPEHPLFDTHCVVNHVDEVAPVVMGMRMPLVNDESPHKLVIKRSQCALVLFKPFRAASDLVTDPTSDAQWIDAFRQWEPTRSGFTREIMANMDDYCRAAMQDQECSGNAETETDNDDSGEPTGMSEDVEAALDRAASSDQADPVAGGADAFGRLFDCDESVGSSKLELELDDESTDASALASSFPVVPNAEPSVSSDAYRDLLGAAAHSTATTEADLRSRGATLEFPLDELQRFVNDTTNDEAEPQRSQQYRNKRPTEVVALIIDALEDVPAWSPLPPNAPRSPPPLRPYASVQDASRAYTLNERQHAAFTLITTSLLRRFLRQELGGLQDNDGGCNHTAANLDARLRDDQLLLFLGSPGGIGESRVIDAVDAFCLSWHRDDSVVKAALTGKAATLIGGRTPASFLMRIQHAIKENRFGPIDLLVVDDGQAGLSTARQAPKALHPGAGRPVRGRTCHSRGRLLQMPPVNADPICIDLSDKTTASTKDIEGFDLWIRFSTVVMLEESVRFRRDPEWGEGCRLARLGQWTPAFIALVNSRVIEQPHGQEEESDAEKELERERQWATQPQPTQTLRAQIAHDSVFVTPENATRLAENNAFVLETALLLPNDAQPVRVVANFKGALNGLSRSDIRYVMSLPDSKFGRVAPYLDLIDGMAVQVTQNVATIKDVANGTLGALEHVHFPADTTSRLVCDGASRMVVRLPDRPSEYAILLVPRPHAVPFRAGVDPELFPVFFATEAYAKATISLSRAPNGQRRSVTVRPQQLPFVCAVGSTIYKVQGETLDSTVVVDWRSKLNVVNRPQQTYLLVSRVTSRHAFAALNPFTEELAAWSKPPSRALNEENRLNEMRNATLASIQASQTTVTAMDASS